VRSPILRIPELAIHLNREVNDKGFIFNTQQHLYPILASHIKGDLEAVDKKDEKKPAASSMCAALLPPSHANTGSE
jgi:aspartyl aminopeptidase